MGVVAVGRLVEEKFVRHGLVAAETIGGGRKGYTTAVGEFTAELVAVDCEGCPGDAACTLASPACLRSRIYRSWSPSTSSGVVLVGHKAHHGRSDNLLLDRLRLYVGSTCCSVSSGLVSESIFRSDSAWRIVETSTSYGRSGTT
jgi:hypothetical protein